LYATRPRPPRSTLFPYTTLFRFLGRLRNFVNNAEEPGKNGGRTLAYALYVLARNGAAPIGDLRYFADTKLDDFATPIAKAQLAADRKSTRLNSSHVSSSYAVLWL